VSRFLIKGFLFLPLSEEWYENIGHHRIGWDNRFLNDDQNLGWWVRFPTYSHPKREQVLDARKKAKERDQAMPKNRKMRKYNNYDDFEVKIADIDEGVDTAAAENRENVDCGDRDLRASLNLSQSSLEDDENVENGINTNGSEPVFEDILFYYTSRSAEIKKKKLAQSKFLILAKGNYFSKVYLTQKDLLTCTLYDYHGIHDKIKELFLESNKAILLAEVIPLDGDHKVIEELNTNENAVTIESDSKYPVLYVEESRGWIVRNDWKSNVV
jgi:hypothetical protein